MVTGVDKYEFKLKVDEMKALVSARNYHAAAEIAETINWRKIRNLNALVLAGEVFEQVGRYEDSKEILLLAYDKSPIGRNIIYRLAEIAIKTERFDEAQEYYDEFVDIAPHDNLKFVLKYKMTAAQGLPYKEQIKILEELKEQEYSEEWAYELAFLYHKDMQPEKCVEACDELILWFGDGIYVEKALELKMHYQPLSQVQEEKYRVFRQKRTGVIEVRPHDPLESGEIVSQPVEIPSVQANMGQFNTANLQKEIAKGMEQLAAVKMKNSQKTPYVQRQLQQGSGMGQQQLHTQQQYRETSYADQQEAQSRYMSPSFLQKPYTEQMEQRKLYADQPAHQEQYPQQEALEDAYMGQSATQEPRPMTMEEIQAEWEKTKQAMNDALRDAEDQEPISREHSLEKAEQLMQRLLGIVPQLAKQVTPQEGNPQPVKVQNDLDQAGRIVAGINQLLQEQIDSLRGETGRHFQNEEDMMPYEEEQPDHGLGEAAVPRAPVIPEVSDPTRELPRLPESMIEGKEIGAIDKVEMDGNALQKGLFAEEDNPVMNAWKEAQPGISAIDLLQRVRMGKFTADSNEKPAEQMIEKNTTSDDMTQAAVRTAAESIPQIKQESAEMESLRREPIDDPERKTQQSAAGEKPEMESLQRVLTETSEVEGQQRVTTGNPEMEGFQRVPAENLEMEALRQRVPVENAEMEALRQHVPMENLEMEALRQHVPVENLGMETLQQRVPVENPGMETLQQRVPVENPGMEALRQRVSVENPGMETLQQRVPIENPELEALQRIQMGQLEMQAVQRVPEDSLEMQSVQRVPMESPEMQDMWQMSAEDPNMEALQRVPTGNPHMDAVKQPASGYMDQEAVEQPYFDHEGYQPEFPGGAAMIKEEYLQENMEARKPLPSDQQGRNVEPEFGNEQENLFLAAKPRFLTQAQLQAESVMDGKKNTQATKDFSKEAMAAAHSAGFQERCVQPRLTPEQAQVFSYFVPIAGMEAQIYRLLKGVSEHLQYDKHAQSGNIIIEGISGSGKTVLIMDIIKVLQKDIKRPVGKTGKIDANALNQKDLDVLLDKVSGGCLIIESAGKISRETAVNLSRCMEKDHTGTLYIIEDTEEGIQKALERDSSFAAKFTEKITIPQFSIDELAAFGRAYANDLDYDIDEMGVLALYKRINAIQKLDHVTTLTEVKEIVDEAIDNAEKGVLKKVFGMLTATRANDDNYIILREKDFEES